MEANIRLFGGLRVTVGGRLAQFQTRPTESVCALLAANAGKAVQRSALAEQIWPDSEPEKASQSLRTALFHVRKSLEPCQLRSDRQTVTLDPEGCIIDLIDAEHLYRRSRIVEEVDAEKRDIQKALTIIASDFLEGWQGEWTIAPRNHWRTRRIELALRLAGIALNDGDLEVALRETHRVLTDDEFNEEAWALRLRASAMAEDVRRTVDSFKEARQRLRKELGFDFSPELVDIARLASAGKLEAVTSDRSSTPAERDLMVKIMQDQLEQDPESLLPLLSTESFRKHALQFPLEAWRLLRRSIEQTTGTGEHRVKAISLAIRLADMVDEPEIAFDYGDWLMENVPEDQKEVRYASNMLGYLFFELREWDSAWAYIHRFKDLAQKYGDEAEVSIARMQLATLHWHQGDFAFAEDEYLKNFHALEFDFSSQGRANASSVLCNLAELALVQRDFEKCRHYAERCYTIAITNKVDFLRCAIMAPLGLAKILGGEDQEGRRMIAQCFSQSHRSRYRRLHQSLGDYAAAGLAFSGRPSQAIGVLEAYTSLREAACHQHSKAELMLTDWIKEVAADATPSAEWSLPMRTPDLIAATCDLLDPV